MFLALVDNAPKILRIVTAVPLPIQGLSELHRQMADYRGVDAQNLLALAEQRIAALDGAAVDAFAAKWVTQINTWRLLDGIDVSGDRSDTEGPSSVPGDDGQREINGVGTPGGTLDEPTAEPAR